MHPTMTRRAFAAATAAALTVPARAAEPPPIKIGFAEALTGSLAVIGKSGVLAMQLWAEDVNAKGGLLGRPVKLVYYDNQSNPSTVPGIYTKLLDIDHIDIVLSGYSTNMTAPAMPVVMGHNKLFLSLFCLAVNAEFHYPRYFSMLAAGPDPKIEFSRGFFEIAMAQTPRTATIAVIAADAEFARNASDGARQHIKAAGLKIVSDSNYPPTTTDYTPILRAVKATSPDIVYVASYPADTAGILRAAQETGLKTRLFGGNMVGLATAAMKTQLGPLLNGLVSAEQWVPAPTMQFPGVLDFLKRYQAKAPAEGVDVLGYFLPPWAYARMQLVQQAVEGTGSLDDDKLAAWFHGHTFRTIVGDVAFGPDGEWATPRVIWTQFQNIHSNDLEQFKNPAAEVVLLPREFKSGDLQYPYSAGAR